ncbi:IS630 transposase-related protein [Enterobacteriaceae bacterium LUAb1]
MPYPLTFRQHVLATRAKENLTFSQTAQRFNVGIASVIRWAKNPEPVMKRQKPATKIKMDALRQDVLQFPDAIKEKELPGPV